MDSYSCPTEVITTFRSLSVSSAIIGGYPNMVLIISCHTFFFSKNIACRLSVSTFIAKVSNSIMKSAVFRFSCLKDSIFYLASTIFVLSLNVILISLTNLSQFWVPSSLSSLLSFLCVYMPATPQKRCTKIAMILSLVSMTLLLLRNNLISFHQSSNFIQSLSSYPRSRTILLGITACLFSFASTGAGATDISLSDRLYVSSKASFVIFKDHNLLDNASISFVLCELVLSSHGLYHYVLLPFARQAHQHFTKYYDLRLSLGCNSGKDLR